MEDEIEGIAQKEELGEREIESRKYRTIRGPVQEVQYPNNNRSCRTMNRETAGGSPQLNHSRQFLRTEGHKFPH